MRRVKSFACCVLAIIVAPEAFGQASSATRKDYNCGDGKLVVWTTQDYEEQHVVVRFRDRDGREIRPNVIAPGKFVPMCSRGAFLLFDDTGAHYVVGQSWLMSASGEVLGGYKLGDYTVEHAVTADEALVWVQSFEWDGKIARTRLVALSVDGKLVHDKRYEAATNVVLKHAGKSYTVNVREPALPD